MAASIVVLSLTLRDDDGSGPVLGAVRVRISDPAVNADVAAAGGGAVEREVAVRLPRAAWTALLGALRRPAGVDVLPGTLDSAAPIARDP